ncbi:MAG: PTS sugar transporter subunit IIA [Planctomycetes bacterium]|nr:PTS sugar transporter subunit IIA [Planctomycetota bacterium]
MSLVHFLDPASVLLNPEVEDKWKLLDSMVEKLVGAQALPEDRLEEAQKAVHSRERSVSTGMEAGIAVPHAALPGLGEVLAGMALLPEGIDFQSMDGQPARIVVLLLVPQEEKLVHVATLTEIARRLGDGGFRDRLLACEDGDAVLGVWR